jgi:hypothetical protein
MKRILGLALLALGGLGLFGCPVYPGGGGGERCDDYGGPCGYPSGNCQTSNDCNYGWSCTNSVCTPPSQGGSCYSPSQCPAGQNCGSNNQCTSSLCSVAGCPNGYTCELAGGSLQCVLSPDSGLLPDATVDGNAGDSSVPDSGTVDSGGDTSTFTGCTSDSACAAMGAGAKCLDGVCYSASNQCSDSTQCPNSGECVNGVCTPACSATIPCPTGFTCDLQNSVCTGNSSPCGAADGGGACSAGTTCVQEHCVTPCDEAGACSGGLVCVDGGCIPNQQPKFVCNMEGVQDLCMAGSICLHHNCYIGCNPEAGATACQNAAQFNICKQVSTSTGTYNVCGSATNLGNQCDPTQGQNCTSPEICIDGYCR